MFEIEILTIWHDRQIFAMLDGFALGAHAVS